MTVPKACEHCGEPVPAGRRMYCSRRCGSRANNCVGRPTADEAHRERSRRGGLARAAKLRDGGATHAATAERDYSDEEREFLMAVQAWQKRTGRRFPTATDYLHVAKSLGYRQAQEAG